MKCLNIAVRNVWGTSSPTRSHKESPRTPQEPPKDQKDAPRTPQGHPGDTQAHPKIPQELQSTTPNTAKESAENTSRLAYGELGLSKDAPGSPQECPGDPQGLPRCICSNETFWNIFTNRKHDGNAKENSRILKQINEPHETLKHRCA